jgi:homoserine O-acetyltransferase/O-succinyltransferase
MESILADPEWKGGEYTTQPRAAIRMLLYLRLIAAGAPPLQIQKDFPTSGAADKLFENFVNNYLENYRKMYLWPRRPK